MSLEKPVIVEIAKDFLAAKDFYDKIGYELIGTKDINNETIFLVKESSNCEISHVENLH